MFVGAVPAAFRTNFKYPKDSQEDFDFNFAKPLTFAETKTSPISKEDDNANYSIKYSQQELTWKINDNGGEFFKRKICEPQKVWRRI